MVLLFLGNWRSTLIIALTIPLSILASILVLHALGETLNLMTLGGLALSVGILVDQAIVTIENIERHLHLGTPLEEAILVGAGEIGVPAFVSTLCICIVFVPMFFLSGVARFLFVPLAEAVVFAMLASYILSRTLVPTLVMLLMRGTHGGAPAPTTRRGRACCSASTAPSTAASSGCARAYTLALSALLEQRGGVRVGLPRLLRAVVRPLPGARPRLLPERRRRPDPAAPARADRHADRGDRAPRRRGRGGDPRADPEGPARDDPRQPRRAEQRHQPVVQQRRHDRHARRRDPAVAEGRAPADRASSSALLRAELPKRFPGIEFFFQPADIVTQILNFGLPAAIDVQFTGSNMAANAALAAELVEDDPQIPGAVDAHVHQRLDSAGRQPADGPHAAAADGPVGVQRRPERAGRRCRAARRRRRRSGSTRRTASSTTSRCRRRSTRVDSLDALLNMPVAGTGGAARGGGTGTQLLGNLVEATPARQPAVVSRYNILPAIDVYVSVQGTDLASVAGAGAEAGRRDPAEAAARQPGRAARPGADDAGVVHRPRRRPRDGDRARLPADRRQLPVVDRRRRSSSPRCRRRSPASPGCCSSPARRCRCRR